MRFNKKWKKVLQPDKGKYGIYKKAGIVLLLSIVMFSAVYVLSLIHISEPTRRTPISYAVFCLKKKKKKHIQ